MRQLQKKIKTGTLNLNQDDPFELFIAATNIRYCYYNETHKILGNTYGMCVLQVRRSTISIALRMQQLFVDPKDSFLHDLHQIWIKKPFHAVFNFFHSGLWSSHSQSLGTNNRNSRRRWYHRYSAPNHEISQAALHHDHGKLGSSSPSIFWLFYRLS